MEPLLVADSFRVREVAGVAEVRGFDRHLKRFAAGVAQLRAGLPGAGDGEPALEHFLTQVPAQVALGGAGFPRLEARIDPRTDSLTFDVRVRSLPPMGTQLTLRSASGIPLVTPRIKGPNIVRLAELNTALGSEALLLDADGSVREGATTSLVWWESGELAVTATTDRVDSVTERLLLGIAERLGIPATRRRSSPAALVAREVWAVNALHGIRLVTAIDGQATEQPDDTRLAVFQGELDRTWQPVQRPARADA